jgi:protein phosphatase-4 regulatory subunit 3
VHADEITQAAITPMKMINQTKQNNPDGERFIIYFYADCADVLFKPLEDIPEFKAHNCGQLSVLRPDVC